MRKGKLSLGRGWLWSDALLYFLLKFFEQKQINLSCCQWQLRGSDGYAVQVGQGTLLSAVIRHPWNKPMIFGFVDGFPGHVYYVTKICASKKRERLILIATVPSAFDCTKKRISFGLMDTSRMRKRLSSINWKLPNQWQFPDGHWKYIIFGRGTEIFYHTVTNRLKVYYRANALKKFVLMCLGESPIAANLPLFSWKTMMFAKERFAYTIRQTLRLYWRRFCHSFRDYSESFQQDFTHIKWYSILR